MEAHMYTRVTVGGLALRPSSTGSPSAHSKYPDPKQFPACFCKIRLPGAKVPVQRAPVHILSGSDAAADSMATAATLYFSQEDLGLSPGREGGFGLPRRRHLDIMVYFCEQTRCFSRRKAKVLGSVRIPITSDWSKGSPNLPTSGQWVEFGRSGFELHISISVEAAPRALFEVERQSSLNRQAVHVEGRLRQPVFSCQVHSEEPSHRRTWSGSSLSPWESSSSDSSYRREGGGRSWSFGVYDISGLCVAAAAMATPFLQLSGSRGGRGSERAIPGAWVIMKAECPGGTLKPWGRLEGWREPGKMSMGFGFQLLGGGDALSSNSMIGEVACRASMNLRKGGELSLYTVPLKSRAERDRRGDSDSVAWNVESHNWEAEVGGAAGRSGREGGREEAFVVKLTVERGSGSGRTAVEVGRCCLRRLSDAAVYVALGVAVELSVEACQGSSSLMRQVMRETDMGARWVRERRPSI